MKIAFAGSPDSASKILLALSSKYEVVAVLTKEDAPVGRKRIITPSSVAVTSNKLGVPLRKRNRPTFEDVIWLRAQGAEVCVVVAYGALLSAEVLGAGLKFINVHFSLLPNYRGAAPVQAAILNGDQQTGITIFEIDKGLDTGPILSQAVHHLSGSETSEVLLEDLTGLAIPELRQVLDFRPKPVPQSGVPSYAPKLNRTDGRILATDSVEIAHRKIRALLDEPGVWLETTVGKLAIKSASMQKSDTLGKGAVGFGLEIQERNGHLLLLDEYPPAIKILTIQPEGKKVMTSQEWLRGVREVPVIV